MAVLDTDLDQPKYSECSPKFAYVVVDSAFSERKVIEADGTCHILKEDRRDAGKLLDEAAPYRFIVFEKEPGGKESNGAMRPMVSAQAPPYLYQIDIPLQRTSDAAHEDAGRNGESIRESYELAPGHSYHLWGRMEGFRFLFDVGFRSNTYPLGFRIPE